MIHMIRTTVMLPQETHERLRRIARRTGVPLAQVIRDALMKAADAERPALSFIGVVSRDTDLDAASTANTFPPLSPPVSDATPEELVEIRRQADELVTRRRAHVDL